MPSLSGTLTSMTESKRFVYPANKYGPLILSFSTCKSTFPLRLTRIVISDTFILYPKDCSSCQCQVGHNYNAIVFSLKLVLITRGQVYKNQWCATLMFMLTRRGYFVARLVVTLRNTVAMVVRGKATQNQQISPCH